MSAPALLDDDGGVGRVALGLGHLLPVLVLGEAVGQDGLIGSAAAGAGAFEKVGLEPAAMLVRAFEIQVRRPVRGAVASVAVGRVARLKREGVGAAAVEPDIQNVGDLFVARRIVRPQKVGVGPVEPRVGPTLGDGRQDARVDLGVVQRLAGFLVHDTWPGACPRRAGG